MTRDCDFRLRHPTFSLSLFLSSEREELHNEFMGNERAGNEGTNDSLSVETSRAGTKQPLRRFRCRKSNVVSPTTVRDSGNSYRPAAVVATQEILEPRAAVSLPLITVYDVSKCCVTNKTCVVTSRATHVRGIAICTVDRTGLVHVRAWFKTFVAQSELNGAKWSW